MAHSEISYEIPGEIRLKYQGEFSPVFLAYECVLLEKHSGKSYVYKAANIENGRMEHLCQRNIRLPVAGHDEMAGRIRTCAVAGTGKLEAEARLGNKVREEKLAAILMDVFTRLLPQHGFTVRPQQAELAQHVLPVMGAQEITLAEVEVGTGKTHAYLIAAALAKRGRLGDFWIKGRYPGISYAAEMPVVVSTSSIALQHAILREYIPAISSILMEHSVIKKPLTAVLRKGKEHYVCEQRLRACYREANPVERRLLAPLIDLRSHLDLGGMERISPYLKRRINVSGRCDLKCPDIRRCRYQQFMREAQSDKYDFQVCNHNYLLADTLRRRDKKPPLIPHYQAAIIDEAHKFIDAAQQMYGFSLSCTDIIKMAQEVGRFLLAHREGTGKLHRAAERLENHAAKLLGQLGRHIRARDYEEETERFPAPNGEKIAAHLRGLRCALEDLRAMLTEKPVAKYYKGRCAQALWQMDEFYRRVTALERYGELVCWLEQPAGRDAPNILLCAIPKKLDEMLHRDLWAKRLPYILTSGTLSTGGKSDAARFDRIKQVTGIALAPQIRCSERGLPSPYDHRENVLLYLSQSVPFPNVEDSQYIEAVAREVMRLSEATHGHTAVLFTSYKAMELVLSLVRAQGLAERFPLFCLKRGANGTIERFRKSGNGVLFASGSLWEGIDLPGDVLSSLIIVKLPFAVPDPIGEYERTLYACMEEYKHAVVVPDMLVKLKQGFGRLIRSEADTGVVSILDSRVRAGGPYHKQVLTALPDCAVTGDISGVENFINTKKGPDYFA